MLRLLLSTSVFPATRKRRHFMPAFHQHMRHILRHSSGGNLCASEKAVNDQNFHP
jgi:hypothetical protein